MAQEIQQHDPRAGLATETVKDCSHLGRSGSKDRTGSRSKLSINLKVHSWGPTYSTEALLLKVSQPPKTVKPAGDPAFHSGACDNIRFKPEHNEEGVTCAGSLLPNDSGLCQVDIKLSSTEGPNESPGSRKNCFLTQTFNSDVNR